MQVNLNTREKRRYVSQSFEAIPGTLPWNRFDFFISGSICCMYLIEPVTELAVFSPPPRGFHAHSQAHQE